MGPNFDFRLKVRELGHNCLIFHKPGQQPVWFCSDDVLPVNLSDFAWNSRTNRSKRYKLLPEAPIVATTAASAATAATAATAPVVETEEHPQSCQAVEEESETSIGVDTVDNPERV